MRVRQSRLMSLVEAVANVGSRLSFAVRTQVLGRSRSSGCRRRSRRTSGIGAIFTVVSLVRSYSLRRVFEAVARM